MVGYLFGISMKVIVYKDWQQRFIKVIYVVEKVKGLLCKNIKC